MNFRSIFALNSLLFFVSSEKLFSSFKNSPWVFLNSFLLVSQAVSNFVPSANISFIDFKVLYEFCEIPQHIPDALFAAIPPIIAAFILAGSGPIFFEYLASKPFTWAPVSAGSKLIKLASGAILNLLKFLDVTIKIESLIACPESEVPAALKVMLKFMEWDSSIIS